MNTSKSFHRVEGEEINNSYYVDSLLSGANEWKNIQDIIKNTFKAMNEVIRHQGLAIKDLEKQMHMKANKQELINGLGSKANVNDVMKTFNDISVTIEKKASIDEVSELLLDKANKSELIQLSNSKPSFEEVKNMLNQKIDSIDFRDEVTNEVKNRIEDFNQNMNKKLNSYAPMKEINSIYQILEAKANIAEMNEALNSKASKDSVLSALQRKINKSELDVIVNTKLDIEEFRSILPIIKSKADIEEIEKLNYLLDSKADRADMSNLSQIISKKAEYSDVDMVQNTILDLRVEFNKKTSIIDDDLNQLVEFIKKEMDSFDLKLSHMNQQKADLKDVSEVKNTVKDKANMDHINEYFNRLKEDTNREIAILKEEVNRNNAYLDDKVNDRIITFENNHKNILNDMNTKTNRDFDQINNMLEEIPQINNKLKYILDQQSTELSNELKSLREELYKMNKDIEDIYNRKSDKKDFDILQKKCFNDIDDKVSNQNLDNLYKSLMKEISEINQRSRMNQDQIIKSIEKDFAKELEKKVSFYDMTNALASKADLNAVNSILQTKAASMDLERIKNSVEKAFKDTSNKVDFNKFEAFAKDFRKSLDDLQREILTRSTIKETVNMMKNKADIDDVNKALTQIHDELDVKANLDNVRL